MPTVEEYCEQEKRDTEKRTQKMVTDFKKTDTKKPNPTASKDAPITAVSGVDPNGDEIYAN